MRTRKNLKFDLKKAIIGFFFVFLGLFTSVSLPALISQTPVYADEIPAATTTTPTETTTTPTGETTSAVLSDDSCQKSLSPIGWLVCPTTGKISEATDWLYNKIEDILVISPVPATDGSPIYEIWKYCRGLTNLVFIVFLLIVIYSQITGIGISNYGIKKTLPKLIVVAILVNLSFLICSIAVDASNIIGAGLRDVFNSVAQAAIPATEAGDVSTATKLSYANMYSSLAGGAAFAVGATVIAFESGAIWMLIPTVLGALVAVASGLITIALRQAVVALLIMISPLAIVAYMLPNTENLFQKWKKLLTQMLVFYPMFSLLFGASNLAGFAIIASATDGFGILLGTAVQVFPLFFSWSLMKMSGTFLGTINAKMQGLAAKPLATNRAWADSHRMNTKQKYLASSRAYTPSLKLAQFLSNRRIAREDETENYAKITKERGLAYRANRHYRRDGTPTRQAERDYRLLVDSQQYQRTALRDQNNFNKGISYLAAEGTDQRARLERLDDEIVNASDFLKVEQARGEKIDYENAKGFHKRMEDAVNAHMDATHGYTTDKNGRRTINPEHKFHFAQNSAEAVAAAARYSVMSNIMEGEAVDVQYAAATGAHAYDTQKKIIENKMQKYFEFAPPTQDVVNRLTELTTGKNAIDDIDSIIDGLRILNQRGDTDLLRKQLQNVLDQGVDLGTHASQSLASFLMFEVKDSDPWLRRFGKYINLETARAFNENERQQLKLTYEEYIKGQHAEPDGTIMYAKRGMRELMEGTSLDGIERTALGNFDDSLIETYSYVDAHGDRHLNVKEYLKKREEIQTAIGPQFISSSLKYESGSEQLKSAVKFLTGYEQKQAKDENGNNIVKDGEPVYEWVPMWDNRPGKKPGPLADDVKAARNYFQAKSLQYFIDQTPTQILGMRSDYRKPLMDHLYDAWIELDESKLTPEELAERRDAIAELSDLQTRIDDTHTAEKARDEYKEASEKIKMRLAGREVRRILASRGKLEQIYRTRRSGAANNAKDWMREWLDLDNEALITRYLDNRRKEEKEKLAELIRQQGGDPASTGNPHQIYDEATRISFSNEIEEIYNNLKGEDIEMLYDATTKKFKEWFGQNSYFDYLVKNYRDSNPTADNHDLKEYLTSILLDEINYR